MLKNIYHFWDKRSTLAKIWKESANKYEEALRSNKNLDPQIVESILQERERILNLFQSLLPEYNDKISIVITNDTIVENCAVGLWEGHVYVLVSAALIGRSIDYPEDNIKLAWEWLFRHEVSHIKSGHLPWLFYVRKLFNASLVFSLLSWFPPLKSPIYFWLLFGGWGINVIIHLIFELRADNYATKGVLNPQVLESAERTLFRMRPKTIKDKVK